VGEADLVRPLQNVFTVNQKRHRHSLVAVGIGHSLERTETLPAQTVAADAVEPGCGGVVERVRIDGVPVARPTRSRLRLRKPICIRTIGIWRTPLNKPTGSSRKAARPRPAPRARSRCRCDRRSAKPPPRSYPPGGVSRSPRGWVKCVGGAGGHPFGLLSRLGAAPLASAGNRRKRPR
jgi:hypothetical protein